MATTAFVTIVADTSRTDDQLQRDLDRIIRDVQRQIPDVQVRVVADPDSLNRFTRDTAGRLRDERGRFVRAGRDLGGALGEGISDGADRASFSLADLGSVALSTLGSLTRLTAGAGVAAVSIGGIVGAAGAAVAALGGLEGITNQAAGSLAVLAAARGVLTVALSGVSDVIGSLTGTTEEFEKALESLSPQAQAVAREFRAVSPEIENFRTSLQDALFAQIEGTGLAERFGSTLRQIAPAASQVAAEFGELFLAVGNAATSPRAIENINTVLASTDDLIRTITPKAEKFVSGFLERAAAGTAEFGETAGVLGNVFEVLRSVGQDVGRIFGAIGDAAEATGGSIGGPLAAALDLVADLFESPAGQQFLRTLMELGQTILGTLAPVLGHLLGELAPIIQIIAAGLIPVLDALEGPIKILISALGDALVPIFRELAPVAAALAMVVGEIVVALSPLLPLIGKLISALLPAFIPQIEMLGRIITTLLPLIVQLVETALIPMIPVITELSLLWAEWAEPLTEMIEELVPPLIDLLIELTPLIELTAQAMVLAIRQTRSIASALGDLAGLINSVFSKSIGLVVSLIRGDYQGAMNSFRTRTSDAVQAVTRFFASLPGRTASALGSLGVTLARIARDSSNRFVLGLVNRAMDAITWLRGLPARARGALSGAGSVLFSSGAALIQGFINGILSKLGSVKNAASQIAGAARDFFPFSPAKEGPFSGRGYTTHSGAALMDGFIEGIMGRMPDLTGALGMTMGAGAGALSPAPALAGVTFAPPAVAPTLVEVYLGNERFNDHVDVRVKRANDARDRLAAQGVRR